MVVSQGQPVIGARRRLNIPKVAGADGGAGEAGLVLPDFHSTTEDKLMIGYVTLGASDLPRSKAFYSQLLAELGAKEIMDGGRIVFYGTDASKPMLAVCTPFNQQAPNPGNGVMVAISAGSKEMVSKLYQKALALGAVDDGAPGQRIENVFYGAYVRDPDGNKLAFYVFG